MEVRKFEIVIFIDLVITAILFSVINSNLRLIFAVGFVVGIMTTIFNINSNVSLKENIIIIIIVGVIMMVPMLISEEYLSYQVNRILSYILYSIVQFLSWYILYNISKTSIEFEELKSKSYQRGGLGKKKTILSKEEYKIRREFILNGIREGSEVAYEIKVFVSIPINELYFNSVFDTVGEGLSKILRENYDVISILDQNTYIVLLQNMNEEKFENTMKRIFLWVDSHIINSHKFIQISKIVLRGNIDD